jgi:deoxyribose-phosphate aldolase
MKIETIKSLIDHTILKADASETAVRGLCEEARSRGFGAVCVNPSRVRLAVQCLQGSPVRVCTVAGFPLGANASSIKAAEAELAIQEGAQEIDMVINLGLLKDGRLEEVSYDVESVLQVCRQGGALLKVIIETAYLTGVEKVNICEIARNLGVDFVKTSTGFAPSGAQTDDVALMRRIVGPAIGVKAAGGIRDWVTFKAMVDAGANRIGTSSGIKILEEAFASQEG